MWVLAPVFLSETNLQDVLIRSSVLSILAIGELIVIVTSGIDLSVAGVLVGLLAWGRILWCSHPHWSVHRYRARGDG
jgi:ribose/xylose/arabinose/galactoside ABC-type transport system permease subunit